MYFKPLSLSVALFLGCQSVKPLPSEIGASKVLASSVTMTSRPPSNPGQGLTVHHDGAWTLQQLLDKTLTANPELESSKLRAESARGQLIQAGLYPNPTVGWRTEEMSLNKSGGGQQGPYVNQEIVMAGKLQIAQAAAAHGVTAADWQAVTRWYEVSTKVRVAYFELLAAEREVAVSMDIEKLAKEGLDKADKLQQDGSVLSFDVKKAQVELTLSQGRRTAAEQKVDATKKKLAALVGIPREAIASVSGKLEPCTTNFEWKKILEAALTRSSEIQEAQSLISQANEQLRLSEAQVSPNLQLQARPAYDLPDKNMMLFLEAGVSLPLFNRNQGNIKSAMADVARADAELRLAETRLTERLAESHRRFVNAKRQSVLLEKAVKDAEESLRLVRDGNVLDQKVARYMDVLDALRLLSQVRLELVEMQGEIWKAKSEIEGIIQQEVSQLESIHESGSPCIVLP